MIDHPLLLSAKLDELSPPHCPNDFKPHEYTDPSVVSKTMWLLPQLTLATFFPLGNERLNDVENIDESIECTLM
jgi:hypothetical protein